MRIGQLAAQTAVSVQTIRYYERRGFLKKPHRLSSGYRDYSPEEATIVGFIKRSQNSGFTLSRAWSLKGRNLSFYNAKGNRAQVVDSIVRSW